MPARLGPKPPRRLVQDAVLTLTGVVAALCIGELAVRRFAPQHRPLGVALRHLHRPDAELGYTMVPDFHRHVRGPGFDCDLYTNALGMRDREPGPKQVGRLRVLGLGDSFVLGLHAGAIENSFLRRLESHLRTELEAHPITDATGRRWHDIEFLNAGVDGYGTEQEVGLLERLGPQLQPDAVLLTFYLGNDFTDNSGRTRMTVVDGYPMLEASARGYREHFGRPDRRLRLWLHAHSELYAFFKSRLFHPTLRTFAGRDTQSPSTGVPKSFAYYVYDAGFAATLQAETIPDLDRSLVATRAALGRLRDWCDVHGARLLLVAIPAEQQVSLEARQAWIDRFGLDPTRLDFERPNQRLAALAREAGVPFYDPSTDVAARIAAGAELYLTDDNHWNAAGHAVAAALFAEPTLEHLVAPPPALVGSR